MHKNVINKNIKMFVQQWIEQDSNYPLKSKPNNL